MRVLSLFLVLLLGICTSIYAQQTSSCPPPDLVSGFGSVTGRVLDAETEIPLGFVQLRLSTLDGSQAREGRSNPNGTFSFCDFPAGVIEVTGQLGQLGGRVGPVVLVGGAVESLTLTLAPPTEEGNSGTVTGVFLDASSGEPVEGATVLLPDLGQTVITNEFGRFTFSSLPPGEIDLRVTRLGYAPSEGRVGVLFARTTHTEVRLSTEPIAMEPIEVTAVRQRIVLPGLEELERRIHSGWGKFVLEDEIQRRRPTKLSQMLQETGVDVIGDGAGIRIRRTGCAPLVYVDDVKMTHMPRGGGGVTPAKLATPASRSRFADPATGPTGEAADAVNNLVHPMDVVAIEVYRGPAETPGQYIDSNSRCGVILIWTRRGNIGRR